MNSITPKASIIYLTKNGGELFRQSLDSVFHQECDFPFEVVVVDSGSTDGTLEFLERYPVRLVQIAPGEFNFGLTRDYGFSLGAGEIIVSLSQDAVPAGSAWLQTLCTPFADPEVAVAQGVEAIPGDREVFFWDRIRLSYYTRETVRWKMRHEGVGLSFVNCALRKSVWMENPMGPVEMSEDKIFQRNLARHGHRIVLVPEAEAWHGHQYDRRSLEKRSRNEGLGWRLVDIDYSRRDMLLDIFHPLIWAVLVYGLVTLQVRTSAELLFPWIRPLNLYRGNRSGGRYVQ
ncbi:glycosyltransferase [Desulfuromonas sp. TF]|uniref:glycosyltransferase family 2 protein n=1 Tax=Desulfuromonas sp. TF TaxID=1232410 RepID=UPI000413901B|nr:glycosyltransferase [Desulfuromonas sp. TF]